VWQNHEAGGWDLPTFLLHDFAHHDFADLVDDIRDGESGWKALTYEPPSRAIANASPSPSRNAPASTSPLNLASVISRFAPGSRNVARSIKTLGKNHAGVLMLSPSPNRGRS